MQFRNLTPFDAIAYTGMDTQDRTYHVVAMAVGFRLVQEGGQWRAVVMDDEPTALCLADEHWGDASTSSLSRESDLVPYKPRCDVTVRGHSFAPGGHPARQWTARLRVLETIDERLPEPEPPQRLNPLQGLTPDQRDEWSRTLARHRQQQAALDGRPPRVVLDKRLNISGPSRYQRVPLLGWFHSRTEPVDRVALRWEHSFGGRCEVKASAGGQAAEERTLLNEVCFSNPVGCGWLHRGWVSALRKARLRVPAELPAPQITAWKESVPAAPVQARHPRGEQDASAMATIAARYGRRPAGFMPLGKAWAPRLLKAGTLDHQWLEERHPFLPTDFDFGYWNGAPEDQQIDFPNLLAGCVLETEALVPGGLPMSVRIPPHRAFALMRLDDGVVLPNPMQVDLIELDTGDAERDPSLRLVWRTAVLEQAGVRVLEARYETDPSAPLMRLAPSEGYAPPELSSLQH